MQKSPRHEAGYFTVIGDSWASAREWHHHSPGRPFVGVRFEKGEGWVAFEPKTASGPVDSVTLAEIERLFEVAGSEAWCGESVFLCRVTSIAHGYRVVHRCYRSLGSFIISLLGAVVLVTILRAMGSFNERRRSGAVSR